MAQRSRAFARKDFHTHFKPPIGPVVVGNKTPLIGNGELVELTTKHSERLRQLEIDRGIGNVSESVTLHSAKQAALGRSFYDFKPFQDFEEPTTSHGEGKKRGRFGSFSAF